MRKSTRVMIAFDGSGVATQWMREGSVVMPSSVDVTFDKPPACAVLEVAVDPVDAWCELLVHAPSINARTTSPTQRSIDRDIGGAPLLFDPHPDGWMPPGRARVVMNGKPVAMTGSMVVVRHDLVDR